MHVTRSQMAERRSQGKAPGNRDLRSAISLRAIVFAALLVLAAAAAAGADDSSALLAKAFPESPSAPLAELGRGVGIVFTPDLSVAGNCRFYESLGFACFEDPDWHRVLGQIRAYNIIHADEPVRTLILETHGTNGNGLKLQMSYAPNVARSYISVGALQEHLEPDGIRYIIISACNSGRLLRPSIYNALDPNNGDKLFLPATRGIVDASDGFDPSRSQVMIIAPGSSHIETSLAARVKELAPVTRKLIAASARAHHLAPPDQFAISDMLMEIILRDPRLSLSTTGYVDELSPVVAPIDQSESLFRSFKAQLNAMAAAESPQIAATPAAKTATTKSSKSKPRHAPKRGTVVAGTN